MKNRIFKSALFIIALYTMQSFDKTTAWFKAGSEPAKYEMGVDPKMERNNVKVNTIKSKEEVVGGFGTYMSSMKVGEYAGKRVRMSGYMKSSNLYDWAGFWMRVDAADTQEPLSFDSMQNRAVKGSSDWKKYDIVLDVPSAASKIAYGALVSGGGQIWFDDVRFEIVDRSVETTGFE